MNGFYTSPKADLQNFTAAQSWNTTQHVRRIGDFNGDGYDDILGFGGDKIYISLYNTTQQKFNNLQTAQIANSDSREFTSQIGWNNAQHEREVGDFNGDGLDDIIAFGGSKVFVTLNQGNNNFGSKIVAIDDNLTSAQGWNSTLYARRIADVNGDGLSDIVTFGGSHVYVYLASFNNNQLSLNYAGEWTTRFTGDDGWDEAIHRRTLADVNNDGYADIIGFGAEKTYVAYADPVNNRFKSQFVSTQDFASGWNNTRHERRVGDFNGDGYADIIAFGDAGVIVALFNTQQQKHINIPGNYALDNYGNKKEAGSWNSTDHVRELANLNGDSKIDIVGFGGSKVLTSFAE